MAILLPTSFSVQTAAHIDTRLVVNLLADRDNIAEAIRYWGMTVHVIDSTGANDAETYILNKFEVNDVISNNANWAPLATLGGGNFLKKDVGELSNGEFAVVGDLSTDLNVSLFRLAHPSSTVKSASRTDVYLGAGNGATTPVPWGNIMMGQNNGPSLIATAEWQGSRNIFIGHDIANTWTTPGTNLGTHNFFVGRKVANNTPELSYTIALGYESYSNITQTTPGALGQDIAIGIGTMQGFVSVGATAGDDDENIAIGSYALQNAGSLEAQGGGTNIAIGRAAGNLARLEYYNILMGWDTGEDASLGRGNIGIGARALALATGATWGNIGTGENTYNIGIGVHALEHVRGNQNLAFGVNSGSGLITGDYNSIVGAQGLKLATGNRNTTLGSHAGHSFDFGTTQNAATLVGSDNTFIGSNVTFTDGQPIFSDSVVIGSRFAQVMESNK